MNASYIGTKIAEARKERKMTQQQLAEKLNVTNKAVSKWECGMNYPDISLLKPLSIALEIPLVQLISEDEVGAEQVAEIVTELAVQEKQEIKKNLWKRWAWCAAFALLVFLSQIYLSYTIFHANINGLPRTAANLFVLPFSIIATAIYSMIQLKKL